MTSRTAPRARGPLAAGAVLAALALGACSAGSPQADAAPSPSSSSRSVAPPPSTSASSAAPAEQPAEDGRRLVAGGLSVLQPEGWQGGRTDPGSVEATLASLDPQVADLLRPRLQAAASQSVVGLLLDFGGVRSGDVTDIATFSVLDAPPGPIDQGVAQLEQVFTANGGTSVTTGEKDLPLGTARTVSFDAVAQGTDTHTDVYLVPTRERTLAVSTTYVEGRDTADIRLMLASLRPA